MNYRDLLNYGYCEEDHTYTVVLDKYKLKKFNIDFEKEKENIKQFFKADTIYVE